MEAFLGRVTLVLSFFAMVVMYNIIIYLALYDISPYMGFSDVLIEFLNDFGMSFNKGFFFENIFYTDFIASVIFGVFIFLHIITNGKMGDLFRRNG